jgi:hypothetical protein
MRRAIRIILISLVIFASLPVLGQVKQKAIGLAWTSSFRLTSFNPTIGLISETWVEGKNDKDKEIFRYNSFGFYNYYGIKYNTIGTTLELGRSIGIVKKVSSSASREHMYLYPVINLKVDYEYGLKDGQHSGYFTPILRYQLTKCEGLARFFFSLSVGIGYQYYTYDPKPWQPYYVDFRVIANTNMLKRKSLESNKKHKDPHR